MVSPSWYRAPMGYTMTSIRGSLLNNDNEPNPAGMVEGTLHYPNNTGWHSLHWDSSVWDWPLSNTGPDAPDRQSSANHPNHLVGTGVWYSVPRVTSNRPEDVGINEGYVKARLEQYYGTWPGHGDFRLREALANLRQIREYAEEEEYTPPSGRTIDFASSILQGMFKKQATIYGNSPFTKRSILLTADERSW